MTTETAPVPLDWAAQVVDQLDWHWRAQLRPRFDGLTDEEYFWEPTPGAWNVRPRNGGPGSTGSPTLGRGAMTIDFAAPVPTPAPLTTISWRLGHVIVGVFAARVASHFGGPPASYESWAYASTADQALKQLDEVYAPWLAGVRGWAQEGNLGAPIGPAEGPWADQPRAALVLHINRETIHHGAEIALLRDLWAHRHD